MNPARWGRLIVAAVIAGATGAVLVSAAHWALRSAHQAPTDLHAQLHEQAPLTAAEKDRLAQREAAYQARRAGIERRVKAANGRLARAIAVQPGWTPEVEAASRDVEQAAAELERATLQHVVEMREGLDPHHRPAYDAALVKALSDGAK